MPFIPHTPEETAAMLERIGVSRLEDLFADIPAAMRPKSFRLPKGMTEHDALARMEELSRRNAADTVSFLGAGFYAHHIPAAVDALSSRG